MKTLIALTLLAVTAFVSPVKAELFFFQDGVSIDVGMGTTTQTFADLVQQRLSQNTLLTQTTSFIVPVLELRPSNPAGFTLQPGGHTAELVPTLALNPTASLQVRSFPTDPKAYMWMFDVTVDSTLATRHIVNATLEGSGSLGYTSLTETVASRLQVVETTPGLFLREFVVAGKKIGTEQFVSTFTANSIGVIPEPASLALLGVGLLCLLPSRQHTRNRL